jgi:site-specific recombinase XerD
MTLTVYGKGEKERIVPISNAAWEIIQIPVIRSFVGEDAPVVGLRDRYARAVITRLAVQAGLRRRVSSHDLRATFATAVYDKTLDQKLVQDLLGHSYGSTTEIYLGRSTHQLRDGVEL